jgi:2-amino-4-hydroxy-6-hydroxymethyldihydropteridine diphosphokinase
MPEVFLLLGSNLGNRETYLADARKRIEQEVGEIRRKSSLYLTESWGRADLPDFINQVITIQSDKKPHEILEKTQTIEAELGRERDEKWGSRTIDIDILFYGNECINSVDLTIPHPHLHERRFTLEPLLEIEPELAHPVLKKTIKQLYNNLSDSLIVKLITRNN